MRSDALEGSGVAFECTAHCRAAHVFNLVTPNVRDERRPETSEACWGVRSMERLGAPPRGRHIQAKADECEPRRLVEQLGALPPRRLGPEQARGT